MELKELEKEMQIAPLLTTRPQVQVYGKKVVIKLADTQLQDQTTYRLSLGDALVDNREATPYAYFTYTFSTGNYFDTMEIAGKILDAATGLPDSISTLLLYPADASDSAVLRQRPLYAIKADGLGNFHQPFLPNKAFKIFAIQDLDNNLIYDPLTEKIAFSDSLIQPETTFEHPVLLSLFKETIVTDTTGSNNADSTLSTKPDTTMLEETSPEKLAIGGRKGVKNANKTPPQYRVGVDTLDQNRRSFNITQPLVIQLFMPLSSIDKNKIYLSYDNGGIEVEAINTIEKDAVHLQLSTDWQENKLYTLRLINGWATDSAGVLLPPSKYFFRTKQESDYASATITIDSNYVNDTFILYIYKDTTVLYQKAITAAKVQMKLLEPGAYGMRIIEDANKNGKWDSGNLLQRKQPEQVHSYMGKMMLKAGWDNETHFKPVDKMTMLNAEKSATERPGSTSTDKEEQLEER